MLKFSIILIFTFILSGLYSQELMINGGFETYDPSASGANNYSINYALGWQVLNYTPDLAHSSTGLSGDASHVPRTGDGNARFGFPISNGKQEYFYGQTNSLTAGETYAVSFWVRKDYTTSQNIPMGLPPLQNEADFVDYEALYTFTPTILTHDIRNFDPSTTGGRLDYDMKAEGLMYQSILDTGDVTEASSFFGYPHLTHPQDHYNYTPFDAVFAWDFANTVHIQSGEAEFNPDGNAPEEPQLGDPRGKWEQIHSPVRGVIKNFIVDETDFYNAFIQNRRYGWNAREDFEYKAKIVAWNEIYAGQNVTQRTDFKPAEILENANISFKACKSVNLKSGFHAKSGSEFHAQATSSACGCGGGKSAGSSSENNENSSQEKTDVLQFEEKAVNSMDIRLYPNPGKNKVNLQINDEKVRNFEYLIFDLHGKQIKSELVNGSFTTIQLEKGVYIVKIKTDKEWHTRKLIMY